MFKTKPLNFVKNSGFYQMQINFIFSSVSIIRNHKFYEIHRFEMPLKMTQKPAKCPSEKIHYKSTTYVSKIHLKCSELFRKTRVLKRVQSILKGDWMTSKPLNFVKSSGFYQMQIKTSIYKISCVSIIRKL